MKLVATKKSEQNKALVDPWTAVHLGFGIAAGLMGLNFYWSMAGATAYEVVEHQLEKSKVGQELFKTSGPEIFGNAVVDIGIFGLGWYLGDRWNRT